MIRVIKQNVFFFLFGSSLLFLTSCTTYLIPVESFKQQFAGIDSSKLKDVELTGGGILMVSGTHYLANPITTIKCQDKNGNPAQLTNGPSIEVRFTYGSQNKRTVFYFDRIFVNDTSVTGVESRLIPSIRKTIPLRSVTKIEVQDGKKDFKYANPH